MNVTHPKNWIRRLVGLVALVALAGCEMGVGAGGGYVAVDPTPPPVVITGPTAPVPSVPIIYTGDLALTVYAPALSSLTPGSVGFNVTIREGGAYGPIALKGQGYEFDVFGTGVLDVVELPYGLYDVEVVGLDFYGDAVSYAAVTVTVEEPYVGLQLDLEPVTFSGDILLDLYEPDGGLYAGPIDTVDYVLWELDPTTGTYTLVEEIFELPAGPLDSPMIASLQLGEYYLELDAYDVYGYRIYEWAGEFSHASESTFLSVPLWYAE